MDKYVIMMSSEYYLCRIWANSVFCGTDWNGFIHEKLREIPNWISFSERITLQLRQPKNQSHSCSMQITHVWFGLVLCSTNSRIICRSQWWKIALTADDSFYEKKIQGWFIEVIRDKSKTKRRVWRLWRGRSRNLPLRHFGWRAILNNAGQMICSAKVGAKFNLEWAAHQTKTQRDEHDGAGFFQDPCVENARSEKYHKDIGTAEGYVTSYWRKDTTERSFSHAMDQERFLRLRWISALMTDVHQRWKQISNPIRNSFPWTNLSDWITSRETKKNAGSIRSRWWAHSIISLPNSLGERQGPGYSHFPSWWKVAIFCR